MNFRKCKWYTYNSFLFFSVAFLMLAFVPFAVKSYEETNVVLRNTIAIIFWLSAICGAVTLRIDKRRMDNFRQKLKTKGIRLRQSKSGFVTFSRKKEHIAVYVACGLGIVISVADAIVPFMPDTIALPIVSATLILFAFHCLIDGKNYNTLKLVIKYLEETYENKH